MNQPSAGTPFMASAGTHRRSRLSGPPAAPGTEPKVLPGLVAPSAASKSLILPSAVGEADRQSSGLPLCLWQRRDCYRHECRPYEYDGSFSCMFFCFETASVSEGE